MEPPAPWHRPDPLPLPLATPGGVVDVYREDDASALHAAIEVVTSAGWHTSVSGSRSTGPRKHTSLRA